jgi:uncharacterized protein (DUF3084 family)
MFGLRLILILLIVSGIIAFVGDWIGRYIGRKRLTLFNLRPRYTAITITVATGILITVFTLVIMLLISANVRTALFGLEELETNIKNLENNLKEVNYNIGKKSTELDTIKTNYATLEKTLEKRGKEKKTLEKEYTDLKIQLDSLYTLRDRLQKEVEVRRSGLILFKVNQPIVTTLIEGGGPDYKIENDLKQILSAADAVVRRFGVGTAEKRLIFLSPEELKKAMVFVEAHPKDTLIVRLIASRNVVYGEIVPVSFVFFKNQLVFKAKEEIASGIINGKNPQPEIEDKLKEILSHVNSIAIKKGIVPDPTGYVGNISYAKIYNLARSIRAKFKMVNVEVFAVSDTYTAGPLEVDLKIIEP